MVEPYPIDAAILAKKITDHARAMDADGVLLGKNLLAVAQHIDELIPEGSILVDRARLERLLAMAQYMDAMKDVTQDDGDFYMFKDPLSEYLQPGDLDPLP